MQDEPGINPDNSSKPSDASGSPVKLTARQLALLKFLTDSDRRMGVAYTGIMAALAQPQNPERFVHAAQSFRELLSFMKKVFLDLPQDGSKAEALGRIKELIEWYHENPTEEERSNKFKELEEYYQSTQVQRRQRYAIVIDKVNKDAMTSEREKEKAAAALLKLDDWLSKIAHHGRQTEMDEFSAKLDVFEKILEVLTVDYFPAEQRIRRLMLEASPSNAHFDEMKQLLLRHALADVFFRNSTNSAWLKFLDSEGYFRKPIDEASHSDGTVSFPSWAPAIYLCRCAPSAPAEVAAILDATAESENVQARKELVEVALALPCKLILVFAERARNWIRGKYRCLMLLPEALGKLAAKLATDGYIKEAFEIADTILDVWIDEEKYKLQGETSPFCLAPDAEAYVGDWYYQRLIRTCDPLRVADPLAFIRLLCQKLAKSIRLEHKVRGEEDATFDNSWIARSAIEEHDQNRGENRLKDQLIDAVRDTCIRELQSGRAVGDLVRLLREQRYPVFRRIELHLLSSSPQSYLQEIGDWLSNPEHFQETAIHHELYLLLQRSFGMVGERVQRVYLDWVASGPDLSAYSTRFRDETGMEASDEQVNDFVERWKLRQYAPVEKFLYGVEKINFDDLRKKHQPEEHPEFVMYSQSWVGPTSPLDATQLNQMSVREVVRFLSEWEAPKSHHAPSPEGLGRFLADDVRARATEYADISDSINPQAIRPVYLCYLFSGFERSLKDGAQLNWPKVLAFAKRILVDNLLEPDKTADGFETGWPGVRKEIASLLSEALQQPDTVPFDRRDLVWELIERLMQEPEPTLDFEVQYGGSNMSAVDMSINTGRGEATHALFRYMLWADKCLNAGLEENQQFHAIPEEVIPVLNRILDPQQEPTVTVRAVVAWYLQYLAYLDLNWTKQHLDLIIPTDSEKQHLTSAAFEGYFSFNQANGYLFKNLRGFFERAFDWATQDDEASRFHTPHENCVDHLLTYYWWGLDALDENSLIRRVFETAPAKLRAHAVESAGRSLERMPPVTDDLRAMLMRLQQLLDWRLKSIAEKEPPQEEVVEELREFGWWFTYAQMDKPWLLDKLYQVILLTNGNIEWAHEVLNRLAQFIEIDALKVARVVDSILRSDPAPWNIEYWHSQLEVIFKDIKARRAVDAWKICESTINFIGERGNRSFGDLLE